MDVTIVPVPVRKMLFSVAPSPLFCLPQYTPVVSDFWVDSPSCEQNELSDPLASILSLRRRKE